MSFVRATHVCRYHTVSVEAEGVKANNYCLLSGSNALAAFYNIESMLLHCDF